MTNQVDWDKRNELIESGMPEGLADLIHRFDFAHTEARSELVSLAQEMIRRMESVLRHAEAGESVNPLGEVQSLGGRVDAACARYMCAARTAEVTTKVLKKQFLG